MAVSDTNITIISGRLTRDPEARGGGKVAAFSIASNRFFKRDDGETTEEVVFVDCTAFGFEAEAVLSKLMKGAPVLVEGRLELNRWIGEDGANRQQLRLIANRVTSPALRAKTPEPTTQPQEELPTTADAPTPSRRKQAAVQSNA